MTIAVLSPFTLLIKVVGKNALDLRKYTFCNCANQDFCLNHYSCIGFLGLMCVPTSSWMFTCVRVCVCVCVLQTQIEWFCCCTWWTHRTVAATTAETQGGLCALLALFFFFFSFSGYTAREEFHKYVRASAKQNLTFRSDGGGGGTQVQHSFNANSTQRVLGIARTCLPIDFWRILQSYFSDREFIVLLNVMPSAQALFFSQNLMLIFAQFSTIFLAAKFS